MKSLDDYIKILTNPNPTEEDIYFRNLLMNFIANCHEYIEFISENTMNFLIRVSSTMETLRLENQKTPNSYFQNTLDTWNTIATSLSKIERKHIEEHQQEQKEERMVLSKQKKDGFTNASILIYVAINLGLFLASLLLLFK